MKNITFARILALFGILVATAPLALAQNANNTLPLLHPLFSDHAVLQRDRPVTLWGWATPGSKVKMRLEGAPTALSADGSTTAGDDERWEIKMPAFAAGGPYQLSIEAGPEKTMVSDLMFGDVWLCSGQSNMAFPLLSDDYNKEALQKTLASADNPQLRLFAVPTMGDVRSHEVPDTAWKVASPDSVRQFSAVGYYFGLYLQSHLKVPIGLVNASYSGAHIECFISPERLSELPMFADELSKMKAEAEAPAPATPTMVRWQDKPAVLYNAMIAPLVPFSLRGVAWYQGETTTGSPDFYRNTLLPLLVSDWRTRFNDEKMPFGIVQLPNYGELNGPAGGGWPQWQEAQAKAASEIPDTFLAVTIDTGAADNIHPRNKRPVGERLARRALAVVYGAKEPATGPQLVDFKIEGANLRLNFRNSAGQLELRRAEGQPSGFALAGADQKWFWAEPKIEGDSVVLSSPEVPVPVAAAYAFAPNPPVTLFGADGLPAAPFRTQKW